jgi:hypothetical protein
MDSSRGDKFWDKVEVPAASPTKRRVKDKAAVSSDGVKLAISATFGK